VNQIAIVIKLADGVTEEQATAGLEDYLDTLEVGVAERYPGMIADVTESIFVDPDYADWDPEIGEVVG